jgi:predicted O-methyltransferase YrrM
MTRDADIDQFLQASTFGADPYAAFVERSRGGGLPEIQVSAVFARALELFTQLCHAELILEVGTLGGYSAAWMARAMSPSGRIITLEIDPHHAEVARENLHSVGFSEQVEVRVGAALDLLPALHDDPSILGHVDMAFIDADKENNARYLEHAVALARPGALIIVDNVVRGGGIIDVDDGSDARIAGSREVLKLLGSHPRLSATALQTVGTKGHDGFAMAIVNA